MVNRALGIEEDGSKVVRCPDCGSEYDYTSEPSDLVTYWGDGAPVEVECEECRATFTVREIVVRFFEVE